MMLTILVVSLFGVLEIYSATQEKPLYAGAWRNQLWGMAVGLIVMGLVMARDYRIIVGLAPYLYALGIVFLFLVLTPWFGHTVNGNQSWFKVGRLQFQPSEFAKMFTLLMLVRYLSDVRERPPSVRTVGTASAIWLAPTLLVYLENDTGSALSFTSFFVAVLFLCGVRWTWMATVACALLLAVVVAIPSVKASKDYKAQRIRCVFWPELGNDKVCHQNVQSEIAVGSGGLTGRGFGKGTQGALGFVPEVHTDFIFAVAGEETGFAGSVLLMAAYLFLLLRLLQTARQARDRTGLLLVTGYAALLFYHVVVSVGMVARLLPIMGIPLPLMSFGRSSILATFFGLGLAMNVRLRRFVNG
ncbi:MAG: rod shape-determining protein RodA [Acidobacteria bacterium]|nr:rod shape-determining protein RodA [Acidobacteriota bacterium]